jgi:putative ABC transport system permease protein
LKHLLPPETPNLADLFIDGRILAFAAALSIGSGLLFGVRPARRSPPGGVLVMAEAAFATVLIVGAGLLLHSFWTMINTDFGFQVQSVVTAELNSKKPAVYEQVRERLAAYPGVTTVGAMNVLPLTPEFSAFTAAIEDHLRPPQEPQIPLWSTVISSDLLNALGVRLLRGRAFTAADGGNAPLVVLISRATAQRYWPNKSPIGKHLRPVYQNQWRTIVGVVEDVRLFGVNGPPKWAEGEIYLPLAQALSPPETLSLVMRVNGDAGNLEKSLPGMVKEVCPNCAVGKIAGMATVVANAELAPRSMTGLVGMFALLALGMAAAGIYGVVSQSVLRRGKEIGVRLALGCSRGRVAWLVLGSGLRSTLMGSAIGLFASWAMARWIGTLLYKVPEHDALSFSAAPAVLVVVAIGASLIPMNRAAAIDPARSLRES